MSIRYHWDSTEVKLLANNLAAEPAEVTADATLVVSEAARMLRDLWKENVKTSAGDYAKHYRAAITSYVKGLEAEIKPRPGAMQAGMAFEYGGPSIAKRSVGGPIPIGGGRFIRGPGVGQRVGQDKPHLDMNRAADIVFPWFEREIAGEAEISL